MSVVLVVAAHPDDEVLGCGGAMAHHSRQGDIVFVLFLTGGIKSRYQDEDQTAVSELEIIKEHAIKANGHLGVKPENIAFLGHEDQKLDLVGFMKLVSEIKTVVNDCRPDIVYSHHGGDYNHDHRLCFQATLQATRITPGEVSPKKFYSFEVLSSTERAFGCLRPFVPNIYLNIDDSINLKLAAMAEYKTELNLPAHPRSLEGIKYQAKSRGFEVGINHAEAFYLVRELI